MQIVLTEFKTGSFITIEHSLILTSRKDPSTIGATHCISGIQGPGGLQAFNVKESPEEIGLMCNRASKCDIDPTLLGFKSSAIGN